MQGNYQNFDNFEQVAQNDKDIVNSSLNRTKVFSYLFAQILYSTGWLAIFLFTRFGQYSLYEKWIIAIVYYSSGTITIVLQSLLLYLKQNNVLKQCLGIAFLMINGSFVAQQILMSQYNINTYTYYLYGYILDIQDWYLLVLVEILLLIFIFVSQNNQTFTWIAVLILPALINLITEFDYVYLVLQFQLWLLIFSVACLYLTQTEQEMGEFYLSINILGFMTLFLIKAAQYIYNTFKTQTSIFVTKLQEQKQLQFIFLTYMIAAMCTLLTTAIGLIFNITYSGFFLCIRTTQRANIERINYGFWIIVGFNYFAHLLLYLVHRYSQFHIKSLIAIAYFVLHQLYITGIQYALQCCWDQQQQQQYSLYVQCLYYYISFLQLQFVYGAITLKIKQKFCLKTLQHALIIVPLIANFILVFYQFIIPVALLLIIIFNTFLITYVSQQLLNEDNFFLQFKEDEIMISGALLSDPLALFIYQIVFVHIKLIQS